MYIEYLAYVKYYFKFFTNIILYSPHNNLMIWVLLLWPIYKCGDWGLEMLSNLLDITQLVSDRDNIWTQAIL